MTLTLWLTTSCISLAIRARSNYVLPVMGHAAQTGLPPSVLNVYHPAELVLLALAGLAITVAGALGPAGWAAKTRTATALRAE
jgi:putative ABC transport system permease protein